MDEHFGDFIWNIQKEAVNIQKHQLDFKTAVKVFKDSKRKIFTDEKHSKREERFFCIGKIGNKVVTVRFTYREKLVRIYGAAYWRKGRRYYEEG